ncbi:MAG: glycosyltransferase family 4 protein [Deltaproteobacteria bacterium]|nr:MAG: glycosyltransferase family 4 protein [Deltaproteobacteria bacterium]
MINVLSVISELNFGGGENRLLNFARTIDSNRFRLTVATLYSWEHPLQSQCGSMLRQFAEAGVKVHAIGLPHPRTVQGLRVVKLAGTATTLATAIARLRQLIIFTRPQIVDAHLETALYTAVPAATSAGVPAAVTLYSELALWKLYDSQLKQVLLPSIRRLNLRLCSAIITDSKVRAAELEHFIGRSSPVHVIPNGVHLDKPSRSRSDVLREFGIPENTQAIIYDVYVLCVGYPRLGPAYPLQLRRQAEKLGISDRVRIQAYPGNIADVWSVIDIHVHASSIDSLPNAIIEGMSLGKPAVVSTAGAIPDHVENGRTGLIIQPDDPTAVADALLRLLGNEAFARQLGRAAYQRYLERFTPEVTTRQIESCFESMVEAHRNRRETARSP